MYYDASETSWKQASTARTDFGLDAFSSSAFIADSSQVGIRSSLLPWYSGLGQGVYGMGLSAMILQFVLILLFASCAVAFCKLPSLIKTVFAICFVPFGCCLVWYAVYACSFLAADIGGGGAIAGSSNFACSLGGGFAAYASILSTQILLGLVAMYQYM